MKTTTIDKCLLFLILGLFVLGLYMDNPPTLSQEPQKVRAEVLRSSTPVYNFPSYRTIEPSPEPTKAIKKKPVKKKTPVIKTSRGASQEGLKYLGKFTISHYCSCKICCGDNATGITASGKKVKEGMVAMNGVPFGTKLLIDGKTYIVEDFTA